MKNVAASQDQNSRMASEPNGDESRDLISRVVSEAQARGMPGSADSKVAPRSAYGQNFANYAMNFANYAMNFANYAMNSGVSAQNPIVRAAERASLPNGGPLPSDIDQILERISARAKR